MIKIAIVTYYRNSSPRVLADSLNQFLSTIGIPSRIHYKIKTFKRLLKYKDVRNQYNYITWILYKLIFFLHDRLFLKYLKAYDAIIISDCSPSGFLPTSYNIIELRNVVGNVPIIFYEVYYIGNAPTQLEMLKRMNYPSIERYDWHLSVTDITEIRNIPESPWSQIGLYLKGTKLKPVIKQRFFAIVDFIREGYEEFRKEQILALKELRIPFIALQKKYSISEIRKIYQQATVFFIQFPEAFGLPIAECLSCGSYIVTPDSSWPMSWRLDKNPEVHGPGILPECFIIYNGFNDLKEKLKKMREDYDFEKTPKNVFDVFYKNYPTYYDGNQKALKDFLKRIELKDFS